MVSVGDMVVVMKDSTKESVVVPVATASVGDTVMVMRTGNGERVSVPLGNPSVGDKVFVYKLRTGEFVCLFPGGGGSGTGETPVTVMPPGNFDVLRDGPSTAALSWLLGEGNDGVRIVRRPDRYPTAITDGTVAYEGSGSSAGDSGLDFRLPYYYSAWGRAGSKYSNEYLRDLIGTAYNLPEIIDFGEFEFYIDPVGVYYNFGLGAYGTLRYVPPGVSMPPAVVATEMWFWPNKTLGYPDVIANATATMGGPWKRITGWIGCNINFSYGNVRVRVNGTTVWYKTCDEFRSTGVQGYTYNTSTHGYSLSDPNNRWFQVEILLNDGDPVSNFELQFERAEDNAINTRHHALFYGLNLTK